MSACLAFAYTPQKKKKENDKDGKRLNWGEKKEPSKWMNLVGIAGYGFLPLYGYVVDTVTAEEIEREEILSKMNGSQSGQQIVGSARPEPPRVTR